MRKKRSLYRRNTKGVIVIQAAIFVIGVAVLSSISLDLYRGWSIIDELNQHAESAASLLVRGNYANYQEQLNAVTALLVGQRHISNVNQITITWINENGGVMADPSGTPLAPLPLYEDPAAIPPDNPNFLLNTIRVSVTYPVGSNPPFPNGGMRTITGEIPLQAQAEKSFIKQATAKHFTVTVRTQTFGTTFRPICARGPFSGTVQFWDLICQEGARLTESPVSANNYVVSGFTEVPASFGELADTPPLVTAHATPTFNSTFEQWVQATNTFTFRQQTSTFPCDNASAGTFFVVDQISCAPRGEVFTAPVPADNRYVMIEGVASGINFVGQPQTYTNWDDAGCINPQC